MNEKYNILKAANLRVEMLKEERLKEESLKEESLKEEILKEEMLKEEMLKEKRLKAIISKDELFKDLKIYKRTGENTTANAHTIILNKFFLFIQIPKSASTTVLHVCKNRNLTTTLPCYRHEGLLYLENFIDSKLPVYAVVRNPYTQIFSYFFHKIRYNEITIDNIVTIKEHFKKFVFKEINNTHIRQYDYIQSHKNIKVNIIKFEDNNVIDVLNANFNLNFPNDRMINNNEEQIYIDSKKKIKDFFCDTDLVNLIKRERKKEFEEFGYSTDINDI